MRMKRTVSFLLVLVMMLSLFAGCGQQGGESQSGTESQAGQESMQTTELNDLAPPRTAEDFVAQLCDAMQDRNIPIDLVLEWDDDYSQDIGDTGYSVRLVNGDGSYGELRIVLYYSKTEPGDLIHIQIIRYGAANEQEQEAYSVMSILAATLVDEAMTEEMATELFAAEPAQSMYTTYSGDIGSFSEIREIPYPEGLEYYDSSVVFRQPGKLTHSILREDITFQNKLRSLITYEITFAGIEECYFADKIITTSAPSVEELEQRINDAFVTKGVPITCTLVPYQDYGRWRGVFRWTTLEDPDYAYPEFPLEDFLESGWAEEEITEEVVTRHYHESLLGMYFFVNAGDPVRKDAPVGYIDIQLWGEAPIPELVEVICIACDPENGAADMSNLLDLEFVESDWEGYQERTLQKDDYSIEQIVNLEEGSYRYFIRYQDSETVAVERYPTGEALLDPALLDYEFRLWEPIVVDGLFNFYGDGQGYETYFHGSEDYFFLTDLLNDFLDCTRSHFSIEPYWDNNGEHNNISLPGAGIVLDPSVYRIDNYDVAIEVYYNENIQDYLPEDYWLDTMGSEYILRIPIGISLLMDENLTVEEAIALHSHAIEYDFIATEEHITILPIGYQITVYGTGDVVHVLAEDPETGANVYSVILKAYMEIDSNYTDLLQYLDD